MLKKICFFPTLPCKKNFQHFAEKLDQKYRNDYVMSCAQNMTKDSFHFRQAEVCSKHFVFFTQRNQELFAWIEADFCCKNCEKQAIFSSWNFFVQMINCKIQNIYKFAWASAINRKEDEEVVSFLFLPVNKITRHLMTWKAWKKVNDLQSRSRDHRGHSRTEYIVIDTVSKLASGSLLRNNPRLKERIPYKLIMMSVITRVKFLLT